MQPTSMAWHHEVFRRAYSGVAGSDGAIASGRVSSVATDAAEDGTTTRWAEVHWSCPVLPVSSTGHWPSPSGLAHSFIYNMLSNNQVNLRDYQFKQSWWLQISTLTCTTTWSKPLLCFFKQEPTKICLNKSHIKQPTSNKVTNITKLLLVPILKKTNICCTIYIYSGPHRV
jgi:hypothetical protein